MTNFVLPDDIPSLKKLHAEVEAKLGQQLKLLNQLLEAKAISNKLDREAKYLEFVEKCLVSDRSWVDDRLDAEIAKLTGEHVENE